LLGDERLTLKIGVLANESSWYWREIERAALSRGHLAVRLEFSQLRAGCGAATPLITQAEHDLSRCDAVVVRTMPPGSLEQVVFRMDALARLEIAGVLVINSSKAIECATDKYLATAKLDAAGLPVPRTIVCQETDSAMAAFKQLGRDVVIKPIFGAEGRGICRVTDPDLAFRTFRTIERTGCVIYAQEFIRHPGFDVRVLVLNGRVLGGMKRFGANGDFRTNCARDARAEPHSPTPLECDYALRAARVAGAIFAGIDLLYDESGMCYVVEINAVPGWQAFNRANTTDIAEVLVRELETLLSSRNDSLGLR